MCVCVSMCIARRPQVHIICVSSVFLRTQNNGCAGAVALAKALPACSSLETLNLYGNKIGDAGHIIQQLSSPHQIHPIPAFHPPPPERIFHELHQLIDLLSQTIGALVKVLHALVNMLISYIGVCAFVAGSSCHIEEKWCPLTSK